MGKKLKTQPKIEQNVERKVQRKDKKEFKQKKNDKQQESYQIFVSGLPYECTEQQLRNFFNITDQSILVKLPKYQDTGRCLGYGHVHFTNKEEYQAALKKDGQHIGTRYVNIRPAKGQKQVEPHSGNIPVGCKRIFVKNLPYTITEQELKQAFGKCGSIEDVRMIQNWQTKKFKGFAYIDYKDTASVKKSIKNFHGKDFHGRKLILDGVVTQMKKGFKRPWVQKGGQNQQVSNENNQ